MITWPGGKAMVRFLHPFDKHLFSAAVGDAGPGHFQSAMSRDQD
jgi:hypothetical protein